MLNLIQHLKRFRIKFGMTKCKRLSLINTLQIDYSMAEHNETGSNGEILAINHLKQKGYTVLETNWRFKNLEADIIASIGNTLVVAEVKTRTGNYFGEPEIFVDKQKQKNLIKTANAYVQKNNIDLEVRFDIIAIVLKNSNPSINHIEDAFYANGK